MIIDHQTHWYPLDFFQSLGEDGPLPRASVGDFCELDAFFADLDEKGVDGAVVSSNTQGQVDRFEAARAEEICEALNEHVAAAQGQHPERLIGLGMLPMQDAEAAVAVLDRAIGELDLRGTTRSSTRRWPCARSRSGWAGCSTPPRPPRR